MYVGACKLQIIGAKLKLRHAETFENRVLLVHETCTYSCQVSLFRRDSPDFWASVPVGTPVTVLSRIIDQPGACAASDSCPVHVRPSSTDG